MAEKRRLQAEIERTVKKVHEGRLIFKETMDKFESATNHTQKEKHEADLKKDIKKLQRFRDSIKTWLTSPDIKDKVLLTETRKLIESDMERFKVIEKETKTKAYSKEGLFSDQKKDPLQKEKDEYLEWLRLQISKLQKKADVCEFEMHNINAKKKRNPDRDRMAELGQRLAMFRSHIGKQETLLRLLDNDKIDQDKVRDFRFSFEEFVSNPEQELYKSDHGMFMYEELNLEQLSIDLALASDLDLSGKEGSVVMSGESMGPSVSALGGLDNDDRAPAKTRVARSVSMTSTPIKTMVATLDVPEYLLGHNDSIQAPVVSIVSSQPVNTITTPVLETVSMLETPPVLETSLCDVVSLTDTFSVLCTTATSTVSTLEPYVRPVTVQSSADTHSAPQPLPPPSDSFQSQPPVPVSQPDSFQPHSCSNQMSYYDNQTNYAPIMSQQHQPPPPPISVHNDLSYPHLNIPQRLVMPSTRSTMTGPKDTTFDMILEPGDAMSPFRNHNFQINDVYNNQVIAMEHGRIKQPLSTDSEKARMIIYKNEVTVPEYFPKEPIPGCDTEEYYSRLDSDTLFFIFYYFEGTKAQYLAAKTLKRMSWRFHTGHMCWFQRHEEPKQITDNSESGTYIFYDFETMSRQKKENFTFSYNYLEDKDF